MSLIRSGSARIAFLDSFPRLGGAEQNLVDLLRRIDRGRFMPTVVTSEEGELSAELEKHDIPVLYCPLPKQVSVISRTALGPGLFVRTPFYLMRYLSRLSKTIRSVRPRLIFTNAMKDHISAALLSPVLKKPIIWHFMDFLERPLLRRVVEQIAAMTPTQLVTNSQFTADQFRRLVTCRRKVQPIYEGMDLAEIDRMRRAAPCGPVPEPDGPVIIMVGAVCPEKGQELLIRSLPHLVHKIPGVSAWIVGDEIYATSRHRGGFKTELTGLAAGLGVAENVHFLGWRTDVIPLIERSDIMVNLSDPVLSVETFGRTLIEAMACEKPVIAVPEGGPREIVVEGETGRFLSPYTPETLARMLLDMVGDPEERARMGRAGRRRVEECFTVDTYVRGVENQIDAVLGRRTNWEEEPSAK